MSVRRTLDATFLNTVANHPEVRPWIAGEGPLDLGGYIANPANIALETAHGGWLFVQHEPGIYELHSLFLKAGRGRAALEAWAEAVRYVFIRTDAREIVTRVPADNRGAAYAALRCGFKERFSRAGVLRQAGGQFVDVSFQALTLDAWTATAPEALGDGRWFHATLEGALAASNLPEHPDDEAHDRWVGASILMIRAGNHRKGVWTYNRWARLAGYPLVTILTENPLVIDVGAGVLVEVRDGAMEVIRCP